MKKVFANWKMSLTALLLVGGLMLVSNQAQAQGGPAVMEVSPANLEVKEAGVWVSGSEALDLLDAQIQGPITQALIDLPAGGQQYLFWKHKGLLYDAVYASLREGVSTAKAVRFNYDQVAGAPHILRTTASPLSQTEWQQIFNELVDLLTN